MPVSLLDQRYHTFTCLNAKCGNTFQQTYGSLVKPNEVFCPKCGTAEDITESKRHGEIGKWIYSLSDLDKQRMQKK